MIVDSFLFGWELDMLECRLTELYDVVDKFYLIESSVTFQGSPKPLVYKNNIDRFKEWSNKIVCITAELPITNNPWEREYAARDSLKPYLQDLNDDAIILHGDVDEIPTRTFITNLPNTLRDGEIIVLDHTFYSMAVDWKHPETITGIVVSHKKTLNNLSIGEWRRMRTTTRAVPNGWHFTWLGGEEFIKLKASSFSHTETHIQEYIRQMGEKLYIDGYHVLGEKLIPVDIDDTYPDYIKTRRCPQTWLRPR